MPDRPYRLPAEFNTCLRAASPPQFRIERCFFFLGDYWPPGLRGDPACASCVGWVFVRQAHADHLASGAPPTDILTFFHRHVGVNAFVERVREASRTLNWHSEL